MKLIGSDSKYFYILTKKYNLKEMLFFWSLFIKES